MATRILPPRAEYDSGVASGATIRSASTEIWSGRDRLVDMAVTLWAHDGELGLAGNVAVQVGAAPLSRGKAEGGYAPPRGVKPIGSLPSPKSQNAPKDDRIEPDQVSWLGPLVGGGHDLFGATRFRDIDAAAWSATPLRNYAGTRHHIASSHRGGGADGRAYLHFASD